MQEQSILRQKALELVASGKALIPLYPNSKTPILTAWQHAKLDTEEKVNAIFDAYGDCNIAIEPEDEGLCVVDADLYHEGVPERLQALGLPPTMTITTPRGGKHFYFMGSLRATVGKEDYALGPGIDTRGRGSYVLIPPSVIDGKAYVLTDDRPAVACPDEIETRTAPRHQRISEASVELDLPGNIARAKTRLDDLARRGIVAKLGHRGDDTTYEIACELVRDLGLTGEMAIKLMLEHWYPYCEPNDQPEFIKAKVASAVAYGQNAPGAYASASAAETFANADLSNYQQPAKPDPDNKPIMFLGTKEQNQIKAPTWLVPDLIPDKRITLMSAHKGNFKTFLALDISLSVATGQPTFAGKPVNSGLVFYAAHESMEEIARLHRPAWFTVHGLGPDDEVGFYVGPGPHMSDAKEKIQEWEKAILDIINRDGKPPRMIVLDTYSATMMGWDENNPSDVNKLIWWCRRLILEFECAVLILAHLGKDPTRGTRGSSALEMGVDTVLEITRIEQSKQVKVKVRHHRGAMERAAPWHLEGRPVGGSLVFQAITREQEEALGSDSNPFRRAAINQALQHLNAVRDECAVPTAVLAHHITRQDAGESNERYDARLKEVERKLKKLSTGPLHSFAYGRGQAMRWCLPPGTEPDADGLDE